MATGYPYLLNLFGKQLRKPPMRFRADGSFHILHLTDVHLMDPEMEDDDPKRTDPLTDEARTMNAEVLKKAGYHPNEKNIARIMCEFVLNMQTDTAILPVQDIISLPGEARINEPGKVKPQNWSWKLKDFGKLNRALPRIRKLTEKAGRCKKAKA